MIDTHAHLDFPDFDQDREEVISRFFVTGGTAIINVGVDLVRSRKSIEIAEKHEGVFASVGLHPDFFSQGSTFPDISKVRPFPSSSGALGIPQGQTFRDSSRSNLFREFKELAKNKKVVAVGETGLDYFHITRNPEHGTQEIENIKIDQKKGFLAQIELAQELGLPVIVHCREAWEDLYEIISKVRPFPSGKQVAGIPQGQTFFVLHCYSGDRKDTEKFLKLENVHFSFSGNITFPKPKERAEKLAEAVKMIPLDKIMLDSDAPYLAPQEKRGQRNEPIFIKYIAKKIAQIKGISEKEVERKTDENAVRFFRIEGN